MFKDTQIRYLRIKDNKLFIKYFGEEEEFLTSGKVSIEDFKKKQKPFLKESQKKKNKMIKGWQKRHLRFHNLS